MPQQINLCTPLQQARPQRLAARTLVWMFAGFSALCVGLGALWASHLQRSAQSYQQALQVQAAEATALKAALADARGAGPQSLAEAQQALAQKQARLLQREADLAALHQGLYPPGSAHSDRLAWVARSLPPSVWLTGLQIDAQRFQASGLTLEPESLNTWVDRLGQHPLTAGLRLSTVKLAHTRVDSEGRAVPATADGSTAATGHTAWAFELVSQGPAAASPSPASGAGTSRSAP